ncbi:MAG: hypothetical protein HWE21_05215 [Cytophagia bacterium]|nr:hypothetical protein [Cytophagia bacterium]
MKFNKCLLLLIFLIFSFSCEDESKPDVFYSSDGTLITTDFFDYSEENDLASQMIEVIQRQYDFNKLGEALKMRFGEAHWALAMENPLTQKKEYQSTANLTDEQPSLELIVPLSKNNNERVNALLVWRHLEDGTDIIRVMDREVYENLHITQFMEMQPRLVAGHILTFENQLYGFESVVFGEATVTMNSPVLYTDPPFGMMYCKKYYVVVGGEVIAEFWANCEDMTAVVTPGDDDVAEDSDETSTSGSLATSPYQPTYYVPPYQNSSYYETGGTGSNNDYSNDPEEYTEEEYEENEELPSLYNTVMSGPSNNNTYHIKNYISTLISEFNQFPDTQELAQSLTAARDDTSMSQEDLMVISMTARRMYLQLVGYNFDIDAAGFSDQIDLAQGALFIDLYPEVKQNMGDTMWPLSDEEWNALWLIFKPMLGELLLETLPGGGIVNSLQDITHGTNEGSVTLVAAGVVGLIMEIAPPGKVFKAVWRAGKVVRKGFKFVKYGRRYLNTIGHALESGLKADLDGTLIKISKNTDEIGVVKNGDLIPTKYGSSGSPIGDPEGGYQLFKNGDNYSYKRTPDVSGYSSSDLTKLTEHPNAHVLERHGHDVSDEALIKRANTGIAPDGSTIPSGNPPPYSSKFSNTNTLKEALNNTQPGTSAWNSGTQSGNRRIVTYISSNGSLGKGVPAYGNSFQSTNKALAIYEDIGGGNYRLLTMYPDF